MPIPIESEIRSRVEAFAEELIALIRESAMDVVKDALAETGALRRGRRGPASSPRVSARQKGAKRDPKVLEALTEKLGAFIKKNPGQRIEQIGKALGAPTKELVLPVKKLLAAKEISTKGQKRSTTYYPGGSGRSSLNPMRGRNQKLRGRNGAQKKTPRRKASKEAAKPVTVKPEAPSATA